MNGKKADMKFLRNTQKLMGITKEDLSNDMLNLIKSFKDFFSPNITVLIKSDSDGVAYFIRIISVYYSESFNLKYDNFESSSTSSDIYDVEEFLEMTFNQVKNGVIRFDDKILKSVLQSIVIAFSEYANCNNESIKVKEKAIRLSMKYRKLKKKST